MVNKANEAATTSSADSIDSLMSTCPLNDDLIVIHPMRYSVKQVELSFMLPSDVGSGLPVLKEHDYIMRPVINAFIYLFNEKDDYVLLSEFDTSGEAIKTECLLGDVPNEIQDHFPVITQDKNDKFSILLSHIKLDEAFVLGLVKDKSIRKNQLQQVSVSRARRGKEDHCLMVEDLPTVSPDFSSEFFNFDWSLWSTSDLSTPPLLAKYKSVTPDSHVAVAVIDPVGISIELCTLFNAQYDAGFTHIAETQYPYTIANATKMLIDREAQKGFRKEVKKRVSIAHEPKDYQYGLPTYYERTEKEIENIREDRRDRIIKDYHDVIREKEMTKFQSDRDAYTKALSKSLEEIALDWTQWLESDYTDFALALYSPFKQEQIKLKEIAIANMLGNIQATEVGKNLRDDWIQDFAYCTTEKGQPESKGIGGQIWSTIGVLNSGYQELSKHLKLVYDAGSIDWDDVISNQRRLISDGILAATEATDSIQYSIGEKVAQFVVDPDLEEAWHVYYHAMAERYGYQYGVMNTSLNDVLEDIEDFNAVQLAASAEHILVAKTKTTKKKKLKSKGRSRGGVKKKPKYIDPKVKIKIYQLDKTTTPGVKPSISEGLSYWIAKNVKQSKINDPNSKLAKLTKQSSVFLEKHNGRLTGLLLIAQVANMVSVTNKTFSAKKLEPKVVFEIINSSVGLIQSALAFIQSAKFANNEQAMKQAAKSSIHSFGIKSTRAILELNQATSEVAIARYSSLVNERLTGVARFGYRALPVVGNLLGAITSGFNLAEDIEQQDNISAKVVAVSSLIVNSAALAIAVVALIPGVNAVVGVVALVLAIVGVALDLVHAWIEDSRLETFLKGSFWGVGNRYRYYDELSTPTVSRISFFKDVSDSKVQEVQTKELVAFTDELFRPIFSHSSYDESGWFYKYEDFTLQIYFPGYVNNNSQVSLKVLGVIDEETELLYGRVINADGSLDHSTNKIDMKSAISEGFALEASFKESIWKKDYDSYKFDISYINPNSFPVTLNYSVELDDDAALFWQENVETNIELK
ncbi:toxin VasX [Enterovibrio norvegicus]|uniref:toxin VasX n=1 Tax=Enterovibrio norvegicus TaxID=188144 RepID=UPI00354BBB4A